MPSVEYVVTRLQTYCGQFKASKDIQRVLPTYSPNNSDEEGGANIALQEINASPSSKMLAQTSYISLIPSAMPSISVLMRMIAAPSLRPLRLVP